MRKYSQKYFIRNVSEKILYALDDLIRNILEKLLYGLDNLNL